MKPKGYSRLFLNSSAITTLIVATFAVPSVRAASATWNGTTNATWATLSNWAGPPATVPGAGETATFNNAGNANTALDLGAGVTLGSLVFDTSSAAAYTIGSGAVGSQTLTLGTVGSALTVNSTVANNQLVNANLALSTTGAYSFTNNSASNLTIAGALSASTAGAKALTVTGTGNTSIGGNITNGTGAVSITKTGAGTATLSGTDNFSGGVIASAGALNFTGNSTISTGTLNVGNVASTQGTLGLTGTTSLTGSAAFVNLAGSATSSTGVVNIASGNTLALSGASGGNVGSAASASGAIYNAGTFSQTGTAANSAGIYLGNANNGYGYLRSGGTVTISGRLWLSQNDSGTVTNGAAGVLDVTSDTLTVLGANQTNNGGASPRGPFQVNSTNKTYTTTAGYAGVNVTGGTLALGGGQTASQQYIVNWGTNVYSSLNVSGSGKITNTGAAATSGWDFGHVSNALNTATLSLSGGGTLETAFFYSNSALGANVLNFNNGTMRATAADANGLIQGSGASFSTFIHSGGATIDTNGFGTKITRPLLAPTGNGVNGITLGGTATGYVGAPAVEITGGGGVGAAAVANFNPATGTVTGITITSPGSGYTSAPTVTLRGGNGGATGAGAGTATATATIAPVTGGGLVKSGAGALTLTAANTYTGATQIGAGSLILGAAADVNSTSGITINGTGAKLVQNSSITPTFPVTVTNGTVDGTSTLASVTVGDSAGNVVTHGDAGTGALTIGSLTFNDAATVNLKVTSISPEIATTTLTTGAVNGAGKVTINATSASWSPGQYDLISYTTLGGVGFSEFQRGTVTGLSGRQSATLINVPPVDTTPGSVSLTIAGDNPVWTGALDGNWNTVTHLTNPKNWALITSLTPTDYIDNDIVLFDDTATGTTAVNISTANVTPQSTTFNNSGVANGGLDYVISSSGGFGIANGSASGSVTLNGAGPVTLSSANTYSGGTVVNAGTLKINNASAIGTGTLTIAGSANIDTAGSAITLATNNAQNWNSDFTFLGSSDLNLGTGAVTLNANRTVTTDGSGILTVGGSIGGGFTLTKAGAGTLALTGTSTTGNLKVNAGLLKISAGTLNVASTMGESLIDAGGSEEVATGATLNMTGSTAWFPIGNTASTTSVLSVTGGTVNVTNGFGAQVGRVGGGTLVINSGTFTVNDTAVLGLSIGETAANSVGTVDLNGGTLAVVKIRSIGGTNAFHFNGGVLKPTVTNNTDFFANLATLSTEVRNGGAIIDTNSFNVTIGDAIIHSTVGGDNAIDGGVTKNGLGTLVLSGANAYTGNTTVNGGTLSLSTASLADTSAVVIGASGVLNLSHAATDQVAALTINGVVKANGTYDATTDPGFITGTGKILVQGALSGYASWASSHGLTAGVNDGANDDPDFDGINNLLEYVLGGNPVGAGASDTSILPTQSLDATNLTLTFHRSDLSESDTVLKVQYSTNLTTWSEFATIGAVDALPAVDVTEDSPTTDLDTVVVKIPRSGNEFGGKLFGRVDVVKP